MNTNRNEGIRRFWQRPLIQQRRLNRMEYYLAYRQMRLIWGMLEDRKMPVAAFFRNDLKHKIWKGKTHVVRSCNY